MKLARSLNISSLVLLMVLSLASGCAYTTVEVREKYPAPGPDVKAGLVAVMPPVQDVRPWPALASWQPIPNVRIFSEEMTARIRKGLVDRGLFTGLPAPGDPQAKDTPAQLKITVKNFLLANLGYNAWVVPHLLLDGTVLPVFTGMLVYTQGQVDTGAYLLPSSRMGTTITAKVQYFEKDISGPVLERDYQVKHELGAISERRLLRNVGKGETYGVEIGKEEGDITLDLFVQAMATDARWAYLPEFRRLALAEAVVKSERPLDDKIQAAGQVLDLIKPLAYTEEEVKVLRDGYLDAKPRATIANDMRARWLNLDKVKDLPPSQVVSEEQAKALFDDPSLYKAEVESILAERAMTLAVKVLTFTPPAPKAPAAGQAPVQAKIGGQPLAQLAELRAALVARLKDQPRLQSLLITQAEKAVGPAWVPMQQILTEVDSPVINKYLQKRRG